MKKLLLICCAFICSVNCWAQGSVPSHAFKENLCFRVGIANTLNTKSISSLTGTLSGNRVTSVYMGVESGLSLNKSHRLLYGLQVMNKGVKGAYSYFITPNAPASHLTYAYTLSYVELPVYLQKKFKRVSMQAGIMASYLLRACYHNDWYIAYGKGPSDHYLVTDDVLFKFNKWDWGARLGMQTAINRHLNLEISIQKNFIAVYKFYIGELGYQQTLLLGLKYKVF